MAGLDPGIVVVGPTASGKSRLGIGLARRHGGEILGCDALQLYRGMDVGTAKATAAERLGVPHHMIDILDPTEEFSAGAYSSRARAVLEDIRGRRRIPLVVGGTGFYLRALLEGLFAGPSRDEALRARMRRIIERGGPGRLHRALGRVDPASAARIAAADGERIIRAYEIYLSSGRPMSWWQGRPRDALGGWRWLKIGIRLPRAVLYARIDARVDAMFRAGLLEEVRGLVERFGHGAPAFKGIGYRQAVRHLDGALSLEEAVEETKRESRRYAKRQSTWFGRDPEIAWIDDDGESLEEKADRLVARFLDSGA